MTGGTSNEENGKHTITVEIMASGKPLETRVMDCGPEGLVIQDIIKELGLPQNIIISVKDERPVPMTGRVHPHERIRLISVVSGG